jgi:hypothetical protein
VTAPTRANPITGDETFTRFRRKLEDVVTVAINSGRRVGQPANNTDDFCCPLGCLSKDLHYPSPIRAAGLYDMRGYEHELSDFVQAFDIGDAEGERPGPYFKLGMLYRARFP